MQLQRRLRRLEILLPTCNCLTGFAGGQCNDCQDGYFGFSCDICPQGGNETKAAPRVLDTRASPAAGGAGARAIVGSPGGQVHVLRPLLGRELRLWKMPRGHNRKRQGRWFVQRGLLRSVPNGRVSRGRPVRQMPVAQHDDGGWRDGLLHVHQGLLLLDVSNILGP